MRLDVQLVALLATTTGVGLLMIVSGIHKSALEWRNRNRFCPSCGREIQGRTCGCTSD
jgi:NADH pyrophosphatase NudC (nudix superfamily)